MQSLVASRSRPGILRCAQEDNPFCQYALTRARCAAAGVAIATRSRMNPISKMPVA